MKHDIIHQITVPTPFPVGDVHIYLLEGDSLTLVDAGVKTKPAWEAFLYQLGQLGYQAKDVEQIILTHHHPDHTGFTDQFPRLTSIYGHKRNRVWLNRDETYFERYESFFALLYRQSGVPDKYNSFLRRLRDPLKVAGKGELTGALKEGDVIPGHQDFSVLETPGHAQSHLSFFRKSDKSFIGGDLLLKHISSNPLLEPPDSFEMDRPKPLLQYRESMNRCRKLGIKTVYPGHGPVFDGVQDLIDLRLEKQEHRAQKVLDFMVGSEYTVYQVCEKLFPNHIEKEFGLTMSETIGQLDFLEEMKRIEKRMINGIWLYTNTEFD
ncbi:MBL fold metallo-hydrolase [Sediminibacillus massiliensis]|uniref:MBL fold metallo-hydrolase n=1 Tax=Sediminibacillus massiliensis TaxID=1926277 RepID=UPI00098892D3|nr:MBL fold metallo-hydrolase [Sediminibacillus massiliensis]